MAIILIVDDDRVNQLVLTSRLEGRDHTVITADNGVEALQILETLDLVQVDLAILDLAMPGMDGLTLLNRLRTDPRYNTLPVVILTASGESEDHRAAQAGGASAFLTKPVSSWELVETVSRLVG